MSEDSQAPAVIDLTKARQQRLHSIHEARLEKVRAAFEKALPLPKLTSGKKKKAQKKKPPRR